MQDSTAVVSSVSSIDHLKLSVPQLSRRAVVTRVIIALAGLAILVWAYIGAEMKPMMLYQFRHNMMEYASGFTSPDFAYWREIVREMVVTVQIAIWGTFLAIVLAVPFGLLSSANVAPCGFISRYGGSWIPPDQSTR